MQFPHHHFVTHEDFPAGIRALAHLATRNCSTEIIRNGHYALVPAVTFFPYEDDSFGRRILRVIPDSVPSHRTDYRDTDVKMISRARSLTWVGPRAILVAVNTRCVPLEGEFVRSNHPFFSALDHLCAYTRWTRSQRNQRKREKRQPAERTLYSGCGWELE